MCSLWFNSALNQIVLNLPLSFSAKEIIWKIINLTFIGSLFTCLRTSIKHLSSIKVQIQVCSVWSVSSIPFFNESCRKRLPKKCCFYIVIVGGGGGRVLWLLFYRRVYHLLCSLLKNSFGKNLGFSYVI